MSVQLGRPGSARKSSRRRRNSRARPPPKEIYGDAIEQATQKRKTAESRAERAQREAEDWARLTTFKAKPPPFKIYGDLKQWKEMRMQLKAAAAEVALNLTCFEPPRAAELPAWMFKDGTELRGSDEFQESIDARRPSDGGSDSSLSMSRVGGVLGQRLRDAVVASGAGVHGAGLYGSHEYWEARYARRPLERDGKALLEEWYAPYSAMREVLLPLLKPHDRILHVGCGQSQLGASLYADGFLQCPEHGHLASRDRTDGDETRPDGPQDALPRYGHDGPRLLQRLG